jgi:hypothetical protein
MRAPVPTLLLAALAVLPRPAAAQDAGIGASPDAGVSGLEPTLTSTTPPPVPTEAEVEQVEAENSALQQLMAGELPAAFEIRSLFEVDVTREGAIQARLETLGREITREQRLVETLRLATRTATSAAQPDPDQVVALAVRLRFAQARLQRSQARRAFLSQPATTRAALLHNEERQRAIQEQRRGAAEARAAAEREALEAEQARQEALEAARQAVTEAERALASERARVESYRATLASLRADHADARQGWATTQSSLLERHQALTKSALSPELAPAAADKTFREVLGYIEESRGEAGPGHRHAARLLAGAGAGDGRRPGRRPRGPGGAARRLERQHRGGQAGGGGAPPGTWRPSCGAGPRPTPPTSPS